MSLLETCKSLRLFEFVLRKLDEQLKLHPEEGLLHYGPQQEALFYYKCYSMLSSSPDRFLLVKRLGQFADRVEYWRSSINSYMSSDLPSCSEQPHFHQTSSSSQPSSPSITSCSCPPSCSENFSCSCSTIQLSPAAASITPTSGSQSPSLVSLSPALMSSDQAPHGGMGSPPSPSQIAAQSSPIHSSLCSFSSQISDSPSCSCFSFSTGSSLQPPSPSYPQSASPESSSDLSSPQTSPPGEEVHVSKKRRLNGGTEALLSSVSEKLPGSSTIEPESPTKSKDSSSSKSKSNSRGNSGQRKTSRHRKNDCIFKMEVLKYLLESYNLTDPQIEALFDCKYIQVTDLNLKNKDDSYSKRSPTLVSSSVPQKASSNNLPNSPQSNQTPSRSRQARQVHQIHEDIQQHQQQIQSRQQNIQQQQTENSRQQREAQQKQQQIREQIQKLEQLQNQYNGQEGFCEELDNIQDQCKELDNQLRELNGQSEQLAQQAQQLYQQSLHLAHLQQLQQLEQILAEQSQQLEEQSQQLEPNSPEHRQLRELQGLQELQQQQVHQIQLQLHQKLQLTPAQNSESSQTGSSDSVNEVETRVESSQETRSGVVPGSAHNVIPGPTFSMIAPPHHPYEGDKKIFEPFSLAVTDEGTVLISKPVLLPVSASTCSDSNAMSLNQLKICQKIFSSRYRASLSPENRTTMISELHLIGKKDLAKQVRDHHQNFENEIPDLLSELEILYYQSDEDLSDNDI